ncbi:uncharacterized protein LOC133399283 isoform X1 [Phycodurus eques]|uniref:uncharacterized protein LOC133399283 isoform X1 n=1 Tax=Phycodurus eques TaxID=693459 RepID=UPI002ACE0E57|nr:uncharacterized protein LOC133399283 isoform X1 [Phycodurus eques]
MQAVVLLFWLVCCCAAEDCEDVLSVCQAENSWTRCYKERILTCTLKRRIGSVFILGTVDPSKEWEESPSPEHGVRIPSSALQRSRAPESGDEVSIAVTVLNSAHFKLASRKHGRRILPGPPGPTGIVLGGTVLVVQAGLRPLQNLPEPITLTFKYNKKVASGTCVFWEELNKDDGTGHWSAYGCDTSNTGKEFVCRCNHLSFFAVLVNPDISLSEEDAFNLSLITYVGSALSVVFSIISLIVYSCLNKRQPERAIGLHMHLTGALLCLHLFFLLSCSWARRLAKEPADWACGALGYLLHWSLLAAVCWSALEGFHLYLLLVRVFNIYIRRCAHVDCSGLWSVRRLRQVHTGTSGLRQQFNDAAVLDKQQVPSQTSGYLRHHSGLPGPGGPVQLLHVGPGDLQAVAVARRRRSEGRPGDGEQLVEGLRDRAGPQLRAGFTFWPVEHHLRLPDRHLHLHHAQLAARRLCVPVVFGVDVQVSGGWRLNLKRHFLSENHDHQLQQLTHRKHVLLPILGRVCLRDNV